MMQAQGQAAAAVRRAPRGSANVVAATAAGDACTIDSPYCCSSCHNAVAAWQSFDTARATKPACTTCAAGLMLEVQL